MLVLPSATCCLSVVEVATGRRARFRFCFWSGLGVSLTSLIAILGRSVGRKRNGDDSKPVRGARMLLVFVFLDLVV